MMIIDFTLNYTKRTPDGKVEAGTSEYKGKSQFENSLIISTKFVNCILASILANSCILI